MTEETKSEEALAVVAQPSPPELPIVADDIFVVAKSTEEMSAARESLLAWADHKIAVLEQEAVEAQSNVTLAQSRKWSTKAFMKVLKIAQGRLEYYKRIRTAVDAGYVIMPDLPANTIAVRTSQARPRGGVHSSNWRRYDLPEAISDGSPAGKGRYVDPNIDYSMWDRTEKDSQGRDKTVHLARATDYITDFEFPIALVKPQVIDDTSRAMLLKVFDEIAVLGAGSAKPGKRLAVTHIVGDPIILGRVVRYEGTKRFTCAFLITWWLDTKTL